MTGRRVLQGCETLPPMESGDMAQDNPPKRKRKTTGERFHMLNAFVDCTMAKILRTDVLVWLVLYRDVRGGVAQTSQEDIARRSGVCRRTVGTALRRLEAVGLVAVLHRGGLNRGTSVYRVNALMNES